MAVWPDMLPHPPASRPRRWLYENSLSLVVTALVVLTLAGQFFTGWHDYNDELKQMDLATLTLGRYFQSGHFIEATFENWESEFLQMGLYVLLTAWLRQRGSSESKKLYEKEDVDQDPDPAKEDAPGPVKRGGWVRKLYQNSLSLAFFLLFLGAFYLHALGGAEVYNIEQAHEGEPLVTVGGYMQTSRFWFESFQNWQSEFLSIVSIVVLSIFLRQKGSPESKPVDASHAETGK
ncbi:conserved hypothetical protein [Hymenobacter roseosalivarius DSM 11622]|uniref:Transmembrane protein n=1 Tax=Hymenobacter roseosalivarius DSM 11622 TaxID=645990 RepID=A0A1W1UXR9_9BACT|nr:DUF6766 family protein [Hymenobacter roseosalivarius]SMB85866.1 conserved hypothetical protein [Hymenobacter roseosalivarius DSM 11622]